MKTLILPDNFPMKDSKGETITELNADRIVKTSTDIIGYDPNGNELFTFRGISDFSQFSLADGAEWDIEENPVLTLQQQNAQLLLASAQQAQMFNDIQTQNAAIMLQLAQLQPGGAS